MQIRPFLIFRGQCSAAIALYERAFNTRVAEVMRFGDLPPDPDNPLPDDMKNWVLMATLPMGNTFMRLSDTIGGLNEAVTDRISISVECGCEEVRQAFTVLAEGGVVSHPLESSFFSPCWGNLHDQFGVFWNLVGQADQG